MTRARPTPAPVTAGDTRTRLLKAAEACFEKFGVGRTTMDDVATTAGLSRPTVYRYFADRESLIRAIVATRSGKLIGRFHSYLAQFGSLEDKIVEGMLMLADAGRKDHLIQALTHSETIDSANRLLMLEGGDGEVFAAAAWGPTLEEAGVLTESLTLEKAARWLTSVNLMLIGWLEVAGGPDDNHRELLRLFIAPAFARS
jgi:AcrR family transcriptional regulator